MNQWLHSIFISCCLVLAIPLSSWAAAAFVKSDQSRITDGGHTTHTQAFTGGITNTGDAVVGAVWWNQTTGVLTGVTVCGATATIVEKNVKGGTSLVGASFYAANATSGACSVVATWDVASGDTRIIIHEVTGVSTTLPLDRHAGQALFGPTGTDTITSSPVKTQNNGEYIFGATSEAFGTCAATSGTGYTTRVNVANTHFSEDFIQTSAGNVADTFSNGCSDWFLTFVLTLSTTAITPPGVQTINAVDCSNNEVVIAINDSNDGDTVQIPGGTCTWAAFLNIVNRSITIKGVGRGTSAECASGGQTSFTCLKRAGRFIEWVTKATGNSPAGLSVLRNMTIESTTQGDCSGGAYSGQGTDISGVSSNVRVTGMRFIITGCGGLVTNNIAGVIDNNIFEQNSVTLHSIVHLNTSWQGVGDFGDKSWNVAHTLGGSSNMYIEDNTFTSNLPNNHVFYNDHFYGARVVERFNTLSGGSLQNHGTDSGGRIRGARHREIYRNRCSMPTATGPAPCFALRGTGTARIFDNIGDGNITIVADTNVDRAGPNPRPQVGYFPWSYCDKLTLTSITRSGTVATATSPSVHGVSGSASGSYITIEGANEANFNVTGVEGHRIDDSQFTYTVLDSGPTTATGTLVLSSPFDGNTDNTGYPCLDQVGRGEGDLFTGNGDPTISPVAWPNQVLQPYYVWNNTDDGVLSGLAASNGGDVIVSLRDYYNQNTSFDGVTQHGVGRGTRASRPASCTTGDAWWSTDGGGNWNRSTTETYSSTPGEDGGLDRCTATNTWLNDDYIPYTYPHPLTDTVARFKSITGGHRITGKVQMP